MEKTRLHWCRFDWHTTALARFLARWRVGTNIPSSKAMLAITTRSSINVNPFALRMTILLLSKKDLPDQCCRM
jgi:hypothetical protein